MGKILDSGRTLPDLARIPEGQMVATIRAAMVGTVKTSNRSEYRFRKAKFLI